MKLHRHHTDTVLTQLYLYLIAWHVNREQSTLRRYQKASNNQDQEGRTENYARVTMYAICDMPS